MGDGILKNIKDLTREERLDILARVYLIEQTTAVNKRLNGAVCGIDFYNAALLNGQIKNQFLCGTSDLYDAGYSLDKSGKYELNNFSVEGAYFNLMYRKAVLRNLDRTYNVTNAAAAAYGEVRSAGYEPFWEYSSARHAWIERKPSSVKGSSKYAGMGKPDGLSLSEVRKRNISSLDEFEDVKKYIETSMIKYMETYGCDEGTMVSVLSDIKRLRAPEIKVKATTKVAPATKVPAGTIMSLPQDDKSMLDKTADEEKELLTEIHNVSKMRGKIEPTDMFDEHGTPLGIDQKGNYCYPDGAKYTGSKTYWEDRGVAHDIESGVVYDDPSLSPDLDDYEEDNKAHFDKDGYMITDGGYRICEEDGFCEDDVRTTRYGGEDVGDPEVTEEPKKDDKKSPEQMSLEDFGIKL